MKKYFIGIAIYMICCSFSTKHAFGDQFMEVVMRQIGHSVLLSQGDSITQILPIEVDDQKKYTITFNRSIYITSDSLYDVIRRELKKVNIHAFAASLKSCETDQTILAFIFNSPIDSIQPCRGRTTPTSCYKIEIVMPAEEQANHWPWLIFGGGLSILGLGYAFTKRKKPIVITHHILAEQAETIPIGHSHFDVARNKLIRGNEEQILAEKEALLLMKLVNANGEAVPRTQLIDEIWGEQGLVVISRNIDVLVSKLRKKLAIDDTIKISNVHGIGYKLEVDSPL